MTSFFGAVGNTCPSRWGNLEELDRWIPVTTLSALWASFDLSFKHLTNYECLEIWDTRVSESKRNSLRKKNLSSLMVLSGVLSERNINFGLRSIALGLAAPPFPPHQILSVCPSKSFLSKKGWMTKYSCSPDIGPLSQPLVLQDYLGSLQKIGHCFKSLCIKQLMDLSNPPSSGQLAPLTPWSCHPFLCPPRDRWKKGDSPQQECPQQNPTATADLGITHGVFISKLVENPWKSNRLVQITTECWWGDWEIRMALRVGFCCWAPQTSMKFNRMKAKSWKPRRLRWWEGMLMVLSSKHLWILAEQVTGWSNLGLATFETRLLTNK